jgi:hypothetical protein
MIGIDVLLTTGDRTNCIWKGPVGVVPRVGEHFYLHNPPVGEPAADKYAGHYLVTKVVHLLAYKPRADTPSVYVHVEKLPI